MGRLRLHDRRVAVRRIEMILPPDKVATIALHLRVGVAITPLVVTTTVGGIMVALLIDRVERAILSQRC